MQRQSPQTRPTRRRWIALLPAFALLGAPLLTASAAPSKKGKRGKKSKKKSPDSEDLEGLFQRGLEAREDGELEDAADYLRRAYDLVRDENHAKRGAVLFILVDTLREANKSEKEPQFLCEAEHELVDFVEELEQLPGRNGKKSREIKKSKLLLGDLHDELDSAAERDADFECPVDDDEPEDDPEDPEDAGTSPEADTPEGPEPDGRQTGDEPDPSGDGNGNGDGNDNGNGDGNDRERPRRTLIIAGAATMGVGIAALGVMTGGLVVGRQAQREGDELVDAALAMGLPLPNDDPELLDVQRKGRIGNILALSGGIGGAVFLATGAALLAVGVKKQRKSTTAVRLTPQFGPRLTGATLTLRF